MLSAGQQRGLDGGTQVEAVGARPEEGGPVGGVLHRVGEGQQLLVLVEGRGEEMAERDRGQAGGGRADDAERILGVADGALLEIALLLLFSAGIAQRNRDHDREGWGVTVVAGIPMLNAQADGAKMLAHAAELAGTLSLVDIAHMAAAVKIAAIDHGYVAGEGVVAVVEHGPASRCGHIRGSSRRATLWAARLPDSHRARRRPAAASPHA